MSSALDNPALEPALAETPAARGWAARVTATGLGLAAVALALVATSHAEAASAAARVVAVAIPVGFGLYRLAREPADRFARVLLVAGALFSLTTLSASSDATAYSVGRLSVWLVEPVLVFLILAFPHGRLETRGRRRLAMAVASLVALLYIPAAFLAPFPQPSPWATCGTSCPHNALQLTAQPLGIVDDFMRPARELLSVVLFAAVTVVVARRVRSESSMLQRILLPVLVVALVRVVTLAVYFPVRANGPTSTLTDALGWGFLMSLPAITLAFAVGLLAHRLFVADVLERLARTLPSRPSPREIRMALAVSLDDPQLEVRFRVPDSPSGWVEENGWPARPPPDAAGTRATTEVEIGGRTAVAITHDHELAEDPALRSGVSSYVRTALENQRLTGELRASLEELNRSRARLVTVADKERRRIERDLHDGAQQRLVALQIKLALLGEQLEAESPKDAERVHAFEGEIAITIDEVRRFGRGLYPAVLADRGLEDALNAVARTAAIPTSVDATLTHRYPREVESAVYFACLEALQNAAKHAADATAVRIVISGNGRLRFDVSDNGMGFDTHAIADGSGLTNMRDRIGALGGTLEVWSRVQQGTRVTGMIPVP
jgi:signal transduction histidine kinase